MLWCKVKWLKFYIIPFIVFVPLGRGMIFLLSEVHPEMRELYLTLVLCIVLTLTAVVGTAFLLRYGRLQQEINETEVDGRAE